MKMICLLFRGTVDDQITVMQTFEKAMEEYSNGNYAASLPFFEEYMTSEPDSHFAMFYSGLAYLETEQTAKAVAILEKVAAQDDNYQTKAHWFFDFGAPQKWGTNRWFRNN